MRTAVDTNLISAIWAGEPSATEATAGLGAARLWGGIVISPVTYAELRAYPGASAAFVDGFLEKAGVAVEWNLNRNVWAMAADRFNRYAERRRKERRDPKRVVADYIVGAHALLHADRLMTFDQDIFRRDFPELMLI